MYEDLITAFKESVDKKLGYEVLNFDLVEFKRTVIHYTYIDKSGIEVGVFYRKKPAKELYNRITKILNS